MKLGDTRSDEMIELVDAGAFKSGKCRIKHPRNGMVVLERREVIPGPPFPQKEFHWVVVSIDKPDPA